MKPTLFIHASLAVPNKWDLPSLILEKVNGESLFVLMLKRLKKCQSLEGIYIVTSDAECDKEIVKNVESMSGVAGIQSNVLKISSESKYAFSEKNRFYGEDNLLYEIPVYGFYSAEGMMHYADQLKFETAVIANADEMILMDPVFLDQLINKYAEEEINIRELSIISKDVLVAAYRQKRIVLEKELKANMESLENGADNLKKLKKYSSEQVDMIMQRKKNRLLAINQQFLDIKSLIWFARDKNRRGFLSSIPELLGNGHYFFPLYGKYHLARIKQFFAKIQELSLDNFFDSDNLEIESLTREMPGYLEIEITNRCNLSCTNCPQTKVVREKKDMSLDMFKDIINTSFEFVPFLSLSGYGEPTLHPNLIDFVRYAKEKKFLRVCLETNGVNLTDQMIELLVDAGLDILVLNLDALDKYSGGQKQSESLIEKIVAIKEKKEHQTPYIILQTVKTSTNDEEILQYYNRWEYLVNGVVIVPYNDFLETFESIDTINFSPMKAVNSVCAKTMHSLTVLSDGRPVFCKQKFNDINDLQNGDIFDYWRKNRIFGLKKSFCENCNQWCLVDFYGLPTYPRAGNAQNEQYLYSQLIPEAIEEGEMFFAEKKYEQALDIWEKVLKFDPSNEHIHKRLDELLDTSS